jgi:class 3 adenylate cyclase
MFDTLQAYYALAADAAAAAGGRVVKPIGDGILLSFPILRASQAVEALRVFQERATALWRAFDSECSVQVKASAGAVRSGQMGAPGDERYDIVGDALNRLFKAPWADFVVLAELRTLL